MKIFDYAPHIEFKNDYYKKHARKFLNLFDATDWLKSDVMTDQVMKIFAQAGFEPSNNKMKSLPLYLRMRDLNTTFYIVCKIYDMSMYKKYAGQQLGDSLYKKCFKDGWPYMSPVLIYGPHQIYNIETLQVRSWAAQNKILCMGNERATLDYIKNYGEDKE